MKFISSNPKKITLEKECCLNLKFLKLQPIPSITDLLGGEYEFNLIGGIDFSYSNGESSSPQSLHYINGEELNQY